MFKEFKFRNFRSFKDENILSLEPMNRKEGELDCFSIAEIGKNKILKTGVIYGHNSFGKSNILKALITMQMIVKFCTNTDFEIDVDNFKLNNESQNQPSMFELSFIMDDNTYRYGFEVLDKKIVKEWLFRKKVREVAIFERGSSSSESIVLNTSYEKLKKYTEFTRETELFLSSMVRNNEKSEMKKIHEWLLNNIMVFSADQFMPSVTSDFIQKATLSKKDVLKALQNADLGISDIEIIEKEENLGDMPSFVREMLKEVMKGKEFIEEKFIKTEEIFKHSIYNSEKEKIGEVNFDIRDKESEGTIKLYSILGPILEALEKGYTLFIDELDSKLHHEITKYIVGLFHDLSINKKNAQLIFNTHDFYLLKENIFRRDQIYFAEKNSYGESSIYSLGDFKGIDKKSNILAHYLAGNFGGIGKVKLGD